MKEKENLLKSLSLNVINKWIRFESNAYKREVFRCLKSDKIKLSSPKMGEIIKVINENELTFEGFISYENSIANRIESITIDMERSYAEFDERYRQLVCNAILISYDEEGRKYFGFLARNNKYSESSLIGTIGMAGGHYNQDDLNLYSCLIREVSEELKGISLEYSKINPIGFIREVNDTVSNYHLCVLYSIEIPYEYMGKIESQEKQESLLWMTEVQLKEKLRFKNYDSYLDSWCKIAIDNLL